MTVDVPEPFRSCLDQDTPGKVCDAEAAAPEALFGRAMARVAVGRSHNLWDFRRFSDTMWTIPGMNEVGNSLGLPAIALSASWVVDDPALKQELERLPAHVVHEKGTSQRGLLLPCVTLVNGLREGLAHSPGPHDLTRPRLYSLVGSYSSSMYSTSSFPSMSLKSPSMRYPRTFWSLVYA